MTWRCATASRERGDQLPGTASRARRWILLEQPGPWGADAITDSQLPAVVAQQLHAWSRQVPARVLLLRRPGGRRDPTGQRSLYAGRTDARGGWLERFALDRVEDALDLDLHGLPEADTLGGEPVTAPIYLVCTNGRHDPCCATYGLPVAAAVAATVGDRAWECSHVGGDRFAGNLVCLPEGAFYGHLDPATAREVVAAHETGRIDLPRFRGRSCHPFAVQAAEALVRTHLGLEDHDDMAVIGWATLEDRPRIRFARRDGSELEVELSRHRDAHAEALTCHGPPARPARYTLRTVQVVLDR